MEKVKSADLAAEDLLESIDKKEKSFIVLLIILLCCLIFLISGLSFSVFNVYHYNHGDNTINVGSVLFSYDQGNNFIELINTFPVDDEIGKNLAGKNEYFDFVVSVGFSDKVKKKKIAYDISLVPVPTNTLEQKYVKINLLENSKSILIDGKDVVRFSELKDSKNRPGAKILYSNIVTSDEVNKYVFRMWVSEDYKVDSVSRSFKVLVAIDAY